MNNQLVQKLEDFVEKNCRAEISVERETVLTPLISFIQNKIDSQSEIILNFICTHNSRRSHFSQIWAQTMAYYFGVNNLLTFSGGTETTALFPKVIDTLTVQGFEINQISESANPIYAIQYAQNQHPIIGFSKTMDDNFNPSSDFAAIMTCDSANEACPFVPGAEKRIPIPYKDPKEYDESPMQSEKYREKSIEIAQEMHYVFKQLTLK